MSQKVSGVAHRSKKVGVVSKLPIQEDPLAFVRHGLGKTSEVVQKLEPIPSIKSRG